MNGDQVEVHVEIDVESIAVGTLGASYAGGRRLGASRRYRRVAQSAQRRAGSKSSLVLPRFDWDGRGQCIGYMSARTAMQLGEQGHGEITYIDLADTVDGLTGGDRGSSENWSNARR
ncbi:MAG: hypothetical protein J0H64_07325 [Actinobacteria bacterium]|nr:hypothetical protein [Actinomycetota bacterium]